MLRSSYVLWMTLVALMFGACSEATEVQTTPAPAADLVVTMSEWRFAPANGNIATGTPAVLELRNAGSVLHEWTVVDGHVETEADLRGVQVLARFEVKAGGVARFEVPVLEPGLYEVVCGIPGHIANGMVGTLTVGE